MTEQAQHLEALLAHPGWQIFVKQVGEQWGPKGYATKIKAALYEARQAGMDVGEAVLLVDKVNDAVGEIMRWPADELARLKRTERDVVASVGRRGSL
jgi:hypothetical protein